MTQPRGSSPSGRNPARRQEILDATRRLFDETGSRDTQIEDIARAVGINRAIIYRHFSSKEELFAEVVVTYLVELEAFLADAVQAGDDPVERLELLTDEMVMFGVDHPAFVDSALTLVRRPGDELLREVGRPTLDRLVEAMWRCLAHVVHVLEQGTAEGVFAVEDPALLANVYYTQALGITSMTTLRWSVSPPGDDEGDDAGLDRFSLDQVKRYARLAAVGQARAGA